MIKILSLCVMLAPVLLWSQAEPASNITKVVRVHNARPEKIADMVSGGPAIVRANDTLRAIVIRGKPADVATLEQTIRELDTTSTTMASQDVELTVYLVSGSSGAPLQSSSPAEKLPALAPVIKQLRPIFPYVDYQLLSTMLLRSSEGSRASSMGLLKAFQNASETVPPSYNIGYNSATFSTVAANSTIHLANFYFGTRVQKSEISIQTDVDLQDGQKVVVGKSNIESTDSALFVVLSAKLVR